MVKYLLCLTMVICVCNAKIDAQEMSLISLTDHKTVLLSSTVTAKPVEIKLASPVAADQLIGLAVGDVLPQHEGSELIVLRSDRHVEFYPIPDGKASMLKRYGYCPLANPAKRTALGIAVASQQLIVLAEIDESGKQYAETFALHAMELSKAINRSNFISLKFTDSPHQPLKRVDAVTDAPWTGENGTILLTTAADCFLELYKINQSNGQKIGHGFKQASQNKPVTARWYQQQIVALYQDGSLAEFDQTLPAPRIVKMSPTQHLDVVDFVIFNK